MKMHTNSSLWIFEIIFIFAIMLGINYLILCISDKFNYKKEHRVYHKKVVVYGMLLPIGIYLILNLISFYSKCFVPYEKQNIWQDILLERILIFFVTFFFLFYKIYYIPVKARKNNSFIEKNQNENLQEFNLIHSFMDISPYQREVKNFSDKTVEEFYIANKYIRISKNLKIIVYFMVVIFSFGETIFIYNNVNLWMMSNKFGLFGFICNYIYLLNIWFVFLVVNEIAVFFDGNVKKVIVSYNEENKTEDANFNEMLNEYKTIFKNQLLLTFNKSDVINKKDNHKREDYIYSKIFMPIVERKNIIVETENLSSLRFILPPLINLIFATNRKMVFLTENDEESIQIKKWLEENNIVGSSDKIVVEVLLEGESDDLLHDTNIDICIGTVDLLLNTKDALKNVETVFSVNIDNIIIENSINLSIMTKILAEEKNKSIQYVLFANEVNGLKQVIEAVFYKQTFNYQVVRSEIVKDFHALFYAKDRGWLQKQILPAMANESLGSVLPLLITPLKYNFKNLYAFSNAEPYNDELKSLHVNSPNLKSYINNPSISIENNIKFFLNEHFADNDENTVVAYDDVENNLVLLLKNYIKYANDRKLVNIVSNKYLLRDYMIDNIDFLIQNNDLIGKIIPQHKDGRKLLFYKLLNEMILRPIDEEYLIQELCKISNKVYVNTNNNNSNFVRNELKNLLEEIFSIRIPIDIYLKSEINIKNNKSRNYTYQLYDQIRDELPRTLFRQIKFIASDQKAKILKHIPLYEMYQNYATKQYVVFSGKSYIIDSIDKGNGNVNLIYNDRITNAVYRHKKDVNVSKIDILKKESNYNSEKVIFTKYSVNLKVDVTYAGYFEFANGLTFNHELFKYHSNSEIVKNEYDNHKGIILSFSNDMISSFDEIQKFKIGETLAFLLNEVFKTIYFGSNQYLIVRTITNNKIDFDSEVIKLYSPVVIKDFKNNISLFIMEDTELEKGLLDSFELKLDTTIIPLITDYLEWVLDNNINEDIIRQQEIRQYTERYKSSYIVSDNNENMEFYPIDKYDFLKLGGEKVNDIFDLENTLLLLRLINIRGENSNTKTRVDYINKRRLILEEKEKKKEVLINENHENIENGKDNESGKDITNVENAEKEAVNESNENISKEVSNETLENDNIKKEIINESSEDISKGTNNETLENGNIKKEAVDESSENISKEVSNETLENDNIKKEAVNESSENVSKEVSDETLEHEKKDDIKKDENINETSDINHNDIMPS